MRRCSTLLSVMTVLIAALAGCATEPVPHAFTLYDHEGQPVATGGIALSKKFRQGPIEGDWHLDYSRRPTTRPATRPSQPAHDDGHYTGDVAAQDVSIRLHPNLTDAGLTLRGRPADGSLSGHWYEESIAGPQEMGTFTAIQSSVPATRPVE